METEGLVGLPLVGAQDSIGEDNVVKDLEFLREGSKKSVSVRLYGSPSSVLDRITSLFKTATVKA